MKITEIRDLNVSLSGTASNATVDFSSHDVSLVAVVSDVIRNGKPVVGLGFNSIGRFSQPAIIRNRIVPRLLETEPDALLGNGEGFDCAAVTAVAMQNEKPGGHGDRASAVGAVELAFWDLNAKLKDEPAYCTIARRFQRMEDPIVTAYAAGGYYHRENGLSLLKSELERYRRLGFTEFKIKVGGGTLSQDLDRIDAALTIVERSDCLAVDANGKFNLEDALKMGRELAARNLRWFEEPGDPLDFELTSALAKDNGGALATGENLFSVADVRNLLLYGGLRADRDTLQMDAGLSYGLSEYAKTVELVESHGFSRRSLFPHGGHLINLHIVAGLNLGGCEAYPEVFRPLGGFGEAHCIDNGKVRVSDRPGFGLENKAELSPVLAKILP